jgi:hypothetical protein
MKKILLTLLLVLTLTGAIPSFSTDSHGSLVAVAQRGGGGSRSSGGFSSGGSRGSSSSPSRSSATPSRSTPSSGGFSSGTTRSSGGSASSSGVKPAYSVSSVDKSVAQKAATQGTIFKDRGTAVQRFKTDKAAEFHNSYATEPSVRPNYIPQTFTPVGGYQVNVTYVPWLHGYGYYYGGQWLAYDMMQDEMAMHAAMAQSGYLVADAGMSPLGFLGVLCLLLLIIGVCFLIFRGQ